MMSPVTSRADVEVASDISEPTEAVMMKNEMASGVVHSAEPTPRTLKVVHRTRSGAAKLDAALQALNEQTSESRGGSRRSSFGDQEQGSTKRETRRSNSKNSTGRASEESVRSEGRKSNDGGSRKSQDGSVQRRSVDSQRSSTTDNIHQDDTSDQLTQITDILLARLITTLSDSTLGNPALLLQTLLGFSPDDYNDLLAALSESRLSYVDIISAYLHNIRVMSEDSGSTSAALSGTLTRSLIEQYNSLLAQAVKSPQSIARATLIGDGDGRSHLADLLQKANAAEGKPEQRRPFESLLPKGPSGLGFGRRHSTESNKHRQQQNLMTAEGKATTQSMTDSGMMDFSKLFGSLPKLPVTDLNGTSAGVSPQGTAMGSMTQEQLAALLQSTGMLSNGGTHYPPPQQQQQQQQPSVPSLPFLPNTAGGGNMNGMLALNNAYAMHQMQPWTVPMQQHQMNGAASTRGGIGWQGQTTMGFQQAGNLFRGWGGAGLETVHENFHGHLQQQDPSCFAQAINMQSQHGQQ